MYRAKAALLQLCMHCISQRTSSNADYMGEKVQFYEREKSIFYNKSPECCVQHDCLQPIAVTLDTAYRDRQDTAEICTFTAGSTCTHICDPWQHSLQHLCSRPANDHAHDMLLLLHSEVLVEEGPQLVLLGSHMLLQGGSHGGAHALQLTGVLTQLLQAAAGLNPVEHLPGGNADKVSYN